MRGRTLRLAPLDVVAVVEGSLGLLPRHEVDRLGGAVACDGEDGEDIAAGDDDVAAVVVRSERVQRAVELVRRSGHSLKG